MKAILNKIRKPEYISRSSYIKYALILFGLGILLGIFSKALDETAQNLLPFFLGQLDLRNFFSRMGVWMFAGICIALYAKTPHSAAVSVGLFFIGMVGSYYVYTIKVVGFFPKSYMMIWIGWTLLSPLLGMICWYAKGTHMVSVCISAGIFMMMTRQAFHFGFWYFDIRYFLELILWVATIFVLYQNPKQIVKVVGFGLLLFFLTSPWHFMFFA